MPQPIEWVYANADFVVGQTYSGSSRKANRPNAQVVALTIFANAINGTTTTYREMYERLYADLRAWALQPGRASKHRRFFREQIKTGKSVSLHSYRMPKDFYKEWIETNFEGIVWVTTDWIGAKTKLHLDAEVFDISTPALARLSADELVPIIKGVAHYPYDPNHNLDVHASRMVYGYWTMP